MASKKKQPFDVTTQVLIQIREGVDKMRAELVEAIGETNDRVDILHTRLVKTELRLASQHAEILAGLEQLSTQLSAGALRDEAIHSLVERVEALERKVS